ncbi:MAG: MFS transporter, partial [Pyrinomonadaceae bacterium]
MNPGTPSPAPDKADKAERRQLSVAYFLYFATAGLFLPYFPSYLRARGVDGVRIGWILALGPLMRVAVPPLLGFLADRARGPRFWGMVAAWGAVTALAVVWAGDGYAMLLLGAFLYSTFTAPAIPLLDASTVQYMGRTASRFGHIRLWGSVGFVVCSFGLGFAFPGLPAAVIIVSLVGSHLLFALFISAARIEDAPAARPHWRELPQLLRKSSVWLLLLTLFLNRAASAPFNGFYTLFVQEGGLGGGVVAWTWGIAITAEIALMTAVDRYIDRFGTGRVLAAG